MISIVVHHDKQGAITGTRVEDLPEVLARGDCVVWVDVVDPTLTEVARIGEIFHFHPLALEDTLAADIRPKIDCYDGYQFIAFYGLSSDNGEVITHSVDIIIGKTYMVTFHDGGLRVVDETAARWKANVAALDRHGTGFLLYSLLDSLVDGYFPVLDDIAESADSLEVSILEGG